jgi:hypothetical protein
MTNIRKCDFRNDLDDTILYAIQMQDRDGKWFICCESGYPCVYETEAERDDNIKKYEDYQARQKEQPKCNIQ